MSTINHILFVLFSFSGRIGRASWWVAFCVILIVAIAGDVILQPELWDLDSETVPPRNLAVKVFSLAIAVPGFAVTIKRLNDRGWSHFLFWTVVAISLPYYVGQFFGWYDDDPFRLSTAEYVLLVPLLVVTLWIFFDNGFLRGSKGPNRYGPDPLQRTDD